MALAELHIGDRLPATFTAPGLSEAQFLALCEKFPDARVEYTEDGTVIVMPPADPESGLCVTEVWGQSWAWARAVRRGRVIGPFKRTVEIARPGREPELLMNPKRVSGEGPVAGFVLTLERVFTA